MGLKTPLSFFLNAPIKYFFFLSLFFFLRLTFFLSSFYMVLTIKHEKTMTILATKLPLTLPSPLIAMVSGAFWTFTLTGWFFSWTW
jgi:hypothetical protein